MSAPTADGIYWLAHSRIDGKPLVLVLRGANAARAEVDKGANTKTGAMVQSYIMRADVEPQVAARIGEDYSVCGDCVHRPRLVRQGNGAAPCYVKLFHGPRVVWDAFRRGAYARAHSVDALRAYCAGCRCAWAPMAIPARFTLRPGARCFPARPIAPDTLTDGAIPARGCGAWRWRAWIASASAMRRALPVGRPSAWRPIAQRLRSGCGGRRDAPRAQRRASASPVGRARSSAMGRAGGE